MFTSEDAERYRGYEKEITSLKPWRDELAQYGLGDPDGVKQWSGFFQSVKKYGYSPNDLYSVFGDGSGSGAGGGNAPQKQEFNPEAIKSEILGEVNKKYAQNEHSAASKTEERLLAEAVSKVAQGGDPELIGAWFREKAAAARKAYDDSHPLKGEKSPLDQAGVESLLKAWSERAAKNKGASMASTASRANKPVPSVAGANAPSGAPAGDAKSFEERVNDSLTESLRKHRMASGRSGLNATV